MDGSAAEPAEVLSGTAGGGLRWSVRCWWGRQVPGQEPDLMTMLSVSRDADVLVQGSGMGGPPLWPGKIMNEWRGRTDDLPFFVMARVSPDVTRVIATTDSNLEIELPLSAAFEEFGGLRFAAAALPPGHAPGSIRAEPDGQPPEVQRQRMPSRPGRG